MTQLLPLPSPDARFWAMVDRNGTTDCWHWTGFTNNDGYGRVNRRGVVLFAHRIAYVAKFGEHDPSLVLDHLCRVRNCVNPDHLEPVTRRENILRGMGWGGINVNVEHCPAGHEYTSDNTYRYPSGARACRICRNARRKTEKARARERLRLGIGPGHPGRRANNRAADQVANTKAGV